MVEPARPSAAQVFSDFMGPLIGLPVSYFWRGVGSGLFLEFGATNMEGRRSHPRGRMTLQLLWDWRIEGRRTILCGSTTEEKINTRALQLLRSSVVRSAALVGNMKEIELFLTTGLRIQSFSCNRGDPQWSLIDNREWPTSMKSLGSRSGGLVLLRHARALKNVTQEEFFR